jgi:gluconate 2-dehydrogenase gamma chain
MGGQGIERREVLRYIGIASVAAAFPGFRHWSFVCAHPAQEYEGSTAPDGASAGPYKRLFFSTDNFNLVERISEMIIPSDESPGAKEAGVAEFIDFMLANRVPVTMGEPARSVAEGLQFGSQLQVQFLGGIDWLNAHATAEHGKDFLGCTPKQQNDLLEVLAYKAKYKPATETGRDFFQLIRTYTVIGYYTTRIGLESLGYPGLRSVWPAMPSCPNPNDPEHSHVKELQNGEFARIQQKRHSSPEQRKEAMRG